MQLQYVLRLYITPSVNSKKENVVQAKKKGDDILKMRSPNGTLDTKCLIFIWGGLSKNVNY